jgi:hypothetical protein
MRFQGALVKEQGVEFAIVIVMRHVIDNPAERQSTRGGFGAVFPGVPVVLMAQDSRGTPTYWGRSDIVRFLANVPIEAVPWKEYRLN